MGIMCGAGNTAFNPPSHLFIANFWRRDAHAELGSILD